MTIDEMIDVLRAAQDGMTIQYRNKLSAGSWWEAEDSLGLSFDFSGIDYRVKPEPREFWLNVYPHGSVCIHETEEEANRNRCGVTSRTIKVREVLE